MILTLVVLFYLPVNIKFFQTSDTQNVVATKTQVPEDINLQKINNTDLTDSSHDNQELQKSQKLQIKALDKNDNAVKLEEAKNISIQNPSKIVANKQQVNTRQQLLTIKAKKPVKIKMMIDDKQWTFKDLEENNNYNFKFNKELHLMIYDASAVDVFFNDNYLGDLGEPGRIRRLTFMSQNPPLNLNEKTN